jgi:TfoX/Sxy family transcriptional regulator of competence genes
MPFDESLADRVRMNLGRKHVTYEEKKMMGGICFMVSDKICVGVDRDRLLARVGDVNYEAALRKKGCKKMDITGKPLKGFVLVSPIGINTEKQLDNWIKICLEYNPIAKSSKHK